MRTDQETINALTTVIISKHVHSIHEIARCVLPHEKQKKQQQLTTAILKELYLAHLDMFKLKIHEDLEPVEDLDYSLKKLEQEKAQTIVAEQQTGITRQPEPKKNQAATRPRPAAKAMVIDAQLDSAVGSDKNGQRTRQLAKPLFKKFAGKKIETHLTCQICGNKYKHLANHLYKYHGITPEEYKIDFPETTYFVSDDLRVAQSELSENFLISQNRMLTDKEIEFVKNNFSKMKNYEIAKALNLSLPIVSKIIEKHVPEKKIHQNPWTPEEISYLMEHYLTTTHEAIGEALDRSAESVKAKASALDLLKAEPVMPWTRDEEIFMKKNYQHYTYEELAACLGRSHKSVKSKLDRMSMPRKRDNHQWTTEEMDYIKEKYSILTAEKIAHDIGCTVIAVRKQVQKLGLQKMANWKFWTKEEISYLKKNHKKIPLAEIAGYLGRNKGSIKTKLYQLGLSLGDGFHSITEDDSRYIRKNYKKKTIQAMAQEIGCSRSSVLYTMGKLGLKKK